MEKTIKKQQSSGNKPRHSVWDCGSSLYDSYELKSFEKQLDEALSSRSLSMPHLSERRPFLPPPKLHKKTKSKISQSLQKLIRSFFKPTTKTRGGDHSSKGLLIAYDRSGSLSTIPEGTEFDGMSLVRRTTSERFANTMEKPGTTEGQQSVGKSLIDGRPTYTGHCQILCR